MSFISYPTNAMIGGCVSSNDQWRQCENQVGQDQFEVIDNTFASEQLLSIL